MCMKHECYHKPAKDMLQTRPYEDLTAGCRGINGRKCSQKTVTDFAHKLLNPTSLQTCPIP